MDDQKAIEIIRQVGEVGFTHTTASQVALHQALQYLSGRLNKTPDNE